MKSERERGRSVEGLQTAASMFAEASFERGHPPPHFYLLPLLLTASAYFSRSNYSSATFNLQQLPIRVIGMIEAKLLLLLLLLRGWAIQLGGEKMRRE